MISRLTLSNLDRNHCTANGVVALERISRIAFSMSRWLQRDNNCLQIPQGRDSGFEPAGFVAIVVDPNPQRQCRKEKDDQTSLALLVDSPGRIHHYETKPQLAMFH